QALFGNRVDAIHVKCAHKFLVDLRFQLEIAIDASPDGSRRRAGSRRSERTGQKDSWFGTLIISLSTRLMVLKTIRNGSLKLEEMTVFDATLVLGGGVRDGGILPPWAAARFDLALQRNRGEPILCLSAGTTHRPPPLNVQGFPITESLAGASYLRSMGV